MAIEVVQTSPKRWVVYYSEVEGRECHCGPEYPYGCGELATYFRSQAGADHMASWLRDRPGGYELALQHYNRISRKPTRWACGCEEDEDGNVLEKCDYDREAEVAWAMEDGDPAMAIEVVEKAPDCWVVYFSLDQSGCGDVACTFPSRAGANHLASWLRDQPGAYDVARRHWEAIASAPGYLECGCQVDELSRFVERCAFVREQEAAWAMEDGD